MPNLKLVLDKNDLAAVRYYSSFYLEKIKDGVLSLPAEALTEVVGYLLKNGIKFGIHNMNGRIGVKK